MLLDFLLSLAQNLWAVCLIILFFGGSIFVHELGHFLAARRRGVHVERFSIGFGPKIFSWVRDGVEYRLSWLPLGGYVALPQLADMRGIEGESSPDTDRLPPISYATKVIVFAAGAFFNLLFAFALATLVWFLGRPAPEFVTTTRVGYVVETLTLPDNTQVPAPAKVAGLQVNDVIRRVDGRPVHDWNQFRSALVLGTRLTGGGERLTTLTVERGGELRDLDLHPLRVGDERFRTIGIAPAYDILVERVAPENTLGFAPGDVIAAFDGQPAASFELLSEHFRLHPGQPVQLTLLRQGAPVDITVPGYQENQSHPLAGVGFTTRYQLLKQTPWVQFRECVDNTFRTLWGLIHPHGDLALANLSGPIGIGRGFWDAAKSDYPLRFALWFAILVNINLAIFNLLPIPVLDGGHLLFATIGRLRGRALPANFIAATQSVFIVLLFSMILYVTFFDVRRIVRDVRVDAPAAEESSSGDR